MDTLFTAMMIENKQVRRNQWLKKLLNLFIWIQYINQDSYNEVTKIFFDTIMSIYIYNYQYQYDINFQHWIGILGQQKFSKMAFDWLEAVLIRRSNSFSLIINTLRLRQKGRHFITTIFKCNFLNADIPFSSYSLSIIMGWGIELNSSTPSAPCNILEQYVSLISYLMASRFLDIQK